MSPMSQPAHPTPPSRGGPFRRRADLVAVDGHGGPLDELDEQWFLGVTGTVAHLPVLTAVATLRRDPSDPSGSHARCSVFLTRQRAGDEVPRCPACLDLTKAANAEERS